jgi:hypothetical protein
LTELVPVLSNAIGQEGEYAEIDWRCDDARCQRLRVNPFGDGLNIYTSGDIVLGEFWIGICFDNILAGVLGQCGRIRAPYELVSNITRSEVCVADKPVSFLPGTGISVDGGDGDRGSRIGEIPNELN